MLPNDINMLVSFLNTKLRDDDMSLAQILEINDVYVSFDEYPNWGKQGTLF